METENILNNGLETLEKLRNLILEIDNCQSKVDNLENEEARLEKMILTKERQRNDEITSTLRGRKEEVSASYDAQADKIRARMKKVQGKKERLKDAKISERIDIETSDLRDENKDIKIDSKTLFRKNHVPAFCNTKLFYALFQPCSFSDIFILLLCLLLLYLAVPCGIYFFLITKKRIIYLAFIYVADVLITGGLYLFINNRTKDKYSDVIKQGRILRKQIRENRKKIRKIERSIRKDNDESTYGLEKFNKEIQELEKQEEQVGTQKKAALAEYDSTTSKVIEEEIKKRFETELKQLEEEHNQVYQTEKQLEGRILELNRQLADCYEVYLGKEFMSLDKVDGLIRIMSENGASTISEAVAIYHQQN